jgi:hypothetical protein
MLVQVSDASFPVAYSSSVSAASLTLTGTSFYTSDYDAKVSIAGVEADSVTINSGTEVVATWDMGIPPVSGGTALLWFESTATTELYYASSSAITIETAVTPTAPSAVSCSFAGGCTYTVQAAGLASMVAADVSQITVCGETCEYLADASTSEQVSCKVPALSTLYSDA